MDENDAVPDDDKSLINVDLLAVTTIVTGALPRIVALRPKSKSSDGERALGSGTRSACYGLTLMLLACGGSDQRASSRVTPLGGALSSTFRTGDIHAADDAYQGAQEPHCDHLIEALSSSAPVTRPYTTVASISVTCYYGATSACKRRLVERACDLGGDAVILEATEAKPAPTGILPQKEVTQSGKVIRFDK